MTQSWNCIVSRCEIFCYLFVATLIVMHHHPDWGLVWPPKPPTRLFDSEALLYSAGAPLCGARERRVWEYGSGGSG